MAKYNDVTAGQTEAFINRMGGWDNFLRFIGGQGRIVFDLILTFLRAEIIPALSNVTTSKKYFEEAGVGAMGLDFALQFLGLEVEAVKETVLIVRRLDEKSLDEPILRELGDKAEITLSQFKEFLSQNRRNEDGFIFYLKGKNGELWAVSSIWHDHDGWDVSAFSIQSRNKWFIGSQMVSR